MDTGKEVTLMIAGASITFMSRVEACKNFKVGNRYPPGPCPGFKRAAKAKSGAQKIAKAVKGRGKAVAETKAVEKAERKKIAHQLMIRMAAGEKFEIEPDLMPEMMAELDGAPPMNLAMMNVKGEKNKNLFQHHLRDIPRDQMPALPDTVAGMMPLIQELSRMNVKVELIEVDPRELQYTQSELSAPKVAKMQGFMKSGWKPGGAALASRELAIADGHHRAAGAAAAAMMYELGEPGYSPVRMTVLKADMPIDDLLAVAQRFSGKRKAITEAP